MVHVVVLAGAGNGAATRRGGGTTEWDGVDLSLPIAPVTAPRSHLLLLVPFAFAGLFLRPFLTHKLFCFKVNSVWTMTKVDLDNRIGRQSKCVTLNYVASPSPERELCPSFLQTTVE